MDGEGRDRDERGKANEVGEGKRIELADWG